MSTNQQELAEARELVLNAKRRSLGFADGVAARNRVLSKDALLAPAYSYDSTLGEQEDRETHYFIPREGGPRWVTFLGVPAKAPHRDLAEHFINFLIDPKVAASVVSLK